MRVAITQSKELNIYSLFRLGDQNYDKRFDFKTERILDWNEEGDLL